LLWAGRLLARRARPKGRRITREHVVWAYRILLDRDPESEATISAWLQAFGTTEELRAGLMTSPEFRLKNPDSLPYTREKNVVIKEIDDGLRLFVDLSDLVVGLNIVRGCYEQSEVAFVRRTVKPGQTVLDLGANVGFFTMIMASLVGPSGMVYAFEPLRRVADLLEHSIAENGFEDRVRLERAAVGESSGAARLLFEEDTLNSGGSYIFGDGLGIPPGHQLQDVSMIGLDDYAFRRPISFIKMDIEGAEPLALRGARSTLRTDRPTILSEINPVALERVSRCTATQFIAEARAHDYDCHILRNGRVADRIGDYPGPEVQSVVFLPRTE
jgi:FkbM family methyltransferase